MLLHATLEGDNNTWNVGVVDVCYGRNCSVFNVFMSSARTHPIGLVFCDAVQTNCVWIQVSRIFSLRFSFLAGKMEHINMWQTVFWVLPVVDNRRSGWIATYPLNSFRTLTTSKCLYCTLTMPMIIIISSCHVCVCVWVFSLVNSVRILEMPQTTTNGWTNRKIHLKCLFLIRCKRLMEMHTWIFRTQKKCFQQILNFLLPISAQHVPPLFANFTTQNISLFSSQERDQKSDYNRYMYATL